jgi:hypothetical protein
VSEPHYRPPGAALTVTEPPRRAGIVRAVIVALAGFALDLMSSEVLRTVLVYAFYSLVPIGDYPGMDFRDWAASLQDPWSVADLAVGTATTVLAGYFVARYAHGRVAVAFGVMAFMHVYWSLSPGVSMDALAAEFADGILLQVTALNWGATLFGMWLRRRELDALNPSGDSP